MEQKSEQTDQTEDTMMTSKESLLDLESCNAAIEEDGIMKQDFAEGDLAIRCIYFLYGMNYCGSLPRDERIEKIKELLDRDHGNFVRLKSFALSEGEDSPLLHKRAADQYAELCITHDKFMRQQGAVGGFPQMPFFCFQGTDCSYIASVCSWYSIQLQKDIPDKQAPDTTIDIAQYVRRNLFVADEYIDKRVIENKGGSSFSQATDLTGRSNPVKHWINLSTADMADMEYPIPEKTLLLFGKNCLHLLECGGPGLVSNFQCSPQFKEAGKWENGKEKSGYWFFDGGFDCAGEFVEHPTEDEDEDEKEKYIGVFKEEKLQAESERDARIKAAEKFLGKKLEFVASSSDPPNKAGVDDDAGDNDAQVDVESTGYHSMVMLSGVLHESDGGKQKHHFMLLNWWPAMPLVVVTADYLAACSANVHFLQHPLTKDVLFSKTKGCMRECSYIDGGDGNGMEVALEDYCDEDY